LKKSDNQQLHYRAYVFLSQSYLYTSVINHIVYIFVIPQIEQIIILMRHTNYYLFNTDLDCEVEHSFPLRKGETLS
jgi:hypothetical protein